MNFMLGFILWECLGVSCFGNELFWLALGLAAHGYFIGDGLKNFSKPQRKSKYPYLIKEKIYIITFT